MIVLLVLCTVVTATAESQRRLTSPVFKLFTEKYGKVYETPEEHNVRFRNFYRNSKLWAKANREDQGTARYGATMYADLTTEEFARLYLDRADLEAMTGSEEGVGVEEGQWKRPDSVDWRDKGAVTPVKNQGPAGMCNWCFLAFSTPASTGTLEEHSEQFLSQQNEELGDCQVDHGCTGGLPSQAYLEIKRIGGLELESNYPNTGKGGSCHLNRSMSGGIQLPQDEDKIGAWLAANGPVSIGINASLMQFYMGGIAHPNWFLCRPSRLDHGVLITGYGVQDGVPYWRIKNSWGVGWGEMGYYRIYRGGDCCGDKGMATSE